MRAPVRPVGDERLRVNDGPAARPGPPFVPGPQSLPKSPSGARTSASGSVFTLQTRRVDPSRHGAAVLVDGPVLPNGRAELRIKAPLLRSRARVRLNRTGLVNGKAAIALESLAEVRKPDLDRRSLSA